MGRLATIALLLAAGCAAPPAPPPPAPATPVAAEHPAVIAVPREPVAAVPLAPPPGVVAATPAPAPQAAIGPARLGALRASDLVGAWRLVPRAEDGEPADASGAAPVFVVVGADATLAEIVLERGEAPPRTAAQLRPRLAAETRDRWHLEGETLRVERGGGFAPEAWIVARVERAGAIGDARAEIGDVVRTLLGRNGRPGARQLLRRLPGGAGT